MHTKEGQQKYNYFPFVLKPNVHARICRVYCDLVNWDLCCLRIQANYCRNCDSLLPGKCKIRDDSWTAGKGIKLL